MNPTTTDTAPITGAAILVEQALAAHEAERAAAARRQAETDEGDIMRIRRALDAAGITSRPDAVRNLAGGGVCVPVIDAEDTRGWDKADGPFGVYRPAVAVTIRHGEPWVVAEAEETEQPGHLLPVGPFTGLDMIGKALREGGRAVHTPLSAAEAACVSAFHELERVGGDFSADGEVLLAVGTAMTTALLDVAAAIREGRS